MEHVIDEFFKNCNECQLAKQPRNRKVGKYSIKVPTRPGGNNSILILVDGFSKFMLLLLLRDIKAKNIVKSLVEKVWKIIGSPVLIVSDNTSYFNSHMMKYMYFQWGIKHVNTSPYYSCPNLVEMINNNLKVALSIFHNVDQHGWDENLPDNFFWARTVITYPKFVGNSPETSETTCGKELEPFWHQTCINLEKLRISVEKKYNKDRLDNPYTEGDLVVFRHYVRSNKAAHFSSKLAMPYNGPLKILKFLVPVNVLLGDPSNDFIFRKAHLSHIKEYCTADLKKD
ncbi:hypothetical protein PR048_023562 [Dryococelus australis]|uniref:Integrase catalytic domain-containing protein n=1 Tax=Dryococelus australis TaxID=614101 RepID=A0ABQ9GUJ5_9NEOP|nr:hypothetical protein PR048_023562 [Dryococelus australis]